MLLASSPSSRTRPDALTPAPRSDSLGDLRGASAAAWALLLLLLAMLRSDGLRLPMVWPAWCSTQPSPAVGSTSGSTGVGSAESGRFPKMLRRGLAGRNVTGEGDSDGSFSWSSS